MGPIENRDADGKLVFSGIKNNEGQPNEAKITVVDDEAKISGKITEGLPPDKMIKKYHNGKSYEGSLNKLMKEEGNGTITFVDGRKYKDPSVNGQPEGKGVLVTDNRKEVSTNCRKRYTII